MTFIYVLIMLIQWHTSGVVAHTCQLQAVRAGLTPLTLYSTVYIGAVLCSTYSVHPEKENNCTSDIEGRKNQQRTSNRYACIYTPTHTFISWNPVQQEKGEEPQTTANILHSVSLPSYSVVFRVLIDFTQIYISFDDAWIHIVPSTGTAFWMTADTNHS